MQLYINQQNNNQQNYLTQKQTAENNCNLYILLSFLSFSCEMSKEVYIIISLFD